MTAVVLDPPEAPEREDLTADGESVVLAAIAIIAEPPAPPTPPAPEILPDTREPGWPNRIRRFKHQWAAWRYLRRKAERMGYRSKVHEISKHGNCPLQTTLKANLMAGFLGVPVEFKELTRRPLGWYLWP